MDNLYNTKYPLNQQYCKACTTGGDSGYDLGKFAGMYLSAVNDDSEIDALLADKTQPGAVTREQYQFFFEDKIRWDFDKLCFVPYVKPPELIRLEALAAAKGTKLSTLEQNFTAVKYLQEKFVDGALTAEEYAPMRDLRQTWRDKINALIAAKTMEEVNAIEVVEWVKPSK